MTRFVWRWALLLVVFGVPAMVSAGDLMILSWSTDKAGKIQTYTETGERNGDPVVPPVIPSGGLAAISMPALGAFYRVVVDGKAMIVHDLSIKASKRPVTNRIDCPQPTGSSNTATNSTPSAVSGVAVRCP